MQNQAAEQVAKTLKDSNNVLVTVKNGPSVDELTAAIGLTLILNRMGKHAITVFSGRVPSTLEFLQPDMAIDTNTDSLRDFIIALDKSKADKLRYKVEDNVVRIFITPYKTSITDKDLEFSQGDFNVDAVVALGVVTKDDFDQAVTAHGRILHDAIVVAMTNHDVVSTIGAINWQEQSASGVSEMVASITDLLGPDVLDGQIATSLLTGIVAETDRFKNASTTPQVLALSSKLMTAGANQQLIAEKLEEPDTSNYVKPLVGDNSSDDGALEIAHDDEDEIQKIHIDDHGNLELPSEEEPEQPEKQAEPQPQDNSEEDTDNVRSYMKSSEPAKLFGQDDSGTETAQPLFSEEPSSPKDASEVADVPEQSEHGKKVIEPLPAESDDDKDDDTSQVSSTEVKHPYVDTSVDTPQSLADIEKSVDSPHTQTSPEDVKSDDKTSSSGIDNFLGTTRAMPPAPNDNQVPTPTPVVTPEPEEEKEEKKEEKTPEVEGDSSVQPEPMVINPTDPPAVPPPLMPQANSQPQFFDADGSNNNPFLNPNK